MFATPMVRRLCLAALAGTLLTGIPLVADASTGEIQSGTVTITLVPADESGGSQGGGSGGSSAGDRDTGRETATFPPGLSSTSPGSVIILDNNHSAADLGELPKTGGAAAGPWTLTALGAVCVVWSSRRLLQAGGRGDIFLKKEHGK